MEEKKPPPKKKKAAKKKRASEEGGALPVLSSLGTQLRGLRRAGAEGCVCWGQARSPRRRRPRMVKTTAEDIAG